MHESQVTQSINKHVKPHAYVWKIMAAMQAGIPDCYYSGTQSDLWIEFKLLREVPKRATTNILPNLSELQNKWLTNRYDQGRSVAVVLVSPIGCHIYTDCMWNTPIHYDELNLTRKQVAEWILAKING